MEERKQYRLLKTAHVLCRGMLDAAAAAGARPGRGGDPVPRSGSRQHLFWERQKEGRGTTREAVLKYNLSPLPYRNLLNRGRLKQRTLN